MWEDNSYCWVVMCKNNWFHDRVNLFFKHKIPLGETDFYASSPVLQGNFAVRCDECQKEYLYKPSEVLRHDQELPLSFTPHPLFQLNVMLRAVELEKQNVIELATGADRRRSERLLLHVSLIVRGESVEGKLFLEPTFTMSVSAHGALVVLSTKVALGQAIFLKNLGAQKEMEGRVTRFGPQYGNQDQVGINFTQPTLTFWPAVFPPKSWKSVAT
jgi:PilZ domain